MDTPQIIIIAIIIIYVIFTYNSFINLRARVKNSLSDYEVIQEKRFDLIPDLCRMVQGYMKHEAETLTKVAGLRSQAIKQGGSTESRVGLDNDLTRAMGSIMVNIESYPDLKASQNFLKLQSSENEVEEQLSAAKRTFNAIVAEYNGAIQMFPSNIIAMIFNFKSHNFFEVEEYKKENPDISNFF